MKPPFPYIGSKQRLLKRLVLPNIPEHVYYGEVFGGSAAVLLSKPISQIEVYNDINSEVVNFYRMLRESQDELTRLLLFTPYSREEYEKAFYISEEDSSLERARKFFVRARMGIAGLQNASTSFGMSVTLIRRNIPATCSRYLSSIDGFEEVTARLSKVQFENIDFRRFFRIYISKWNDTDPEQTFVYLDPPYIRNVPKEDINIMYQNDTYTEEDDDQLLELITKIYPSVRYMISHYDNEKYNQILHSWRKVCIEIKTTSARKSRNRSRVECIWMNF